jgi:methanogenic corrinoid protein MtbC1
VSNLAAESEHFLNALLAIDRIKAEQILHTACERSSLLEATENIIVPVLKEMGERSISGDVSLSEIYMGGKICEEALMQLPPQKKTIRENQPITAIVALKDYHILGKKIVQSILRSAGFSFIDYGQGASVNKLVQQIRDDKVEILLISVLMLPSALAIKQLKTKLVEEHLNTKIIVGGAPFRFDRQLWQEVGADAMGVSAADAIELIERFSPR